MNIVMRTLVKYFTPYKPQPQVPPVPQKRNDPGEPKQRETDVEVFKNLHS